MKKKLLLIGIIVNILFTSYGQINKNGTPFIKNYTKEDFKASVQNWAVCQDSRGVMYFGNNSDGVLEFNGNAWNKIKVNNQEVRSLAKDSLDFIYVGGNNEFGYLKTDITGNLTYQSLSEQIKDTLNFKEVWKIYTQGTTVYFCSYNYVFVFKDKQYVKTIPNDKGAFWSFLIDSDLYWGHYYDGLQIYSNDSIKGVKGGDFFREKDIFVILPFSENQLFIGTMVQGSYIYNKKTGQVKDIADINNNFAKLSKMLIEGQLYNAIKLNDNNYAFATLDKGCLIVNEEGEILEHYTKHEGLIDNTITDLFQDKHGGLWLNTILGISYIEYQTPFRKFESNSGIDGYITSVNVFKDNLFVGTSAGLYIQKFDHNHRPYFELVDVIDHFVWDMSVVTIDDGKKKLLIATSQNVFELINPSKAIPVNNFDYTNSSCIYPSNLTKDKFFIGFEHGVNSIEFKNGNWHHNKKINGIKEKIISVTEEKNGDIWVSTGVNGLIRIQSDSTLVRYGLSSGLPALENNKVYNFGDELLVATVKGVFYYSEKEDVFKKYKKFGNKFFKSEAHVIRLFQANKNNYWVIVKDDTIDSDVIEKVTLLANDSVRILTTPFKRLMKSSVNNISFSDTGTWIASSDAIFNYQESSDLIHLKKFNSLINNVRINADSVIFHGTYFADTNSFKTTLIQPDILKEKIDYRPTILTFDFSSPFFPAENIKYSCILEGFDDNWLPWDIKSDKDYTNLQEGNYTFKVKAKNIYGMESNVAAYEFTILPPWYRTLVAYVLYFILAVIIVIIIVKIYTRRLELEKIRLEQIVKERTEEVVKQKEEIEKQRDEISDKNRSITDSIEYAKRIQSAVLPSEEFANDILPEHFIFFRPRDIVSGDFYWMTKKNNLLLLIAADCTGHGVPGAFMSMLGVSFLNEIVNRHEIITANAILNQLRADVKKTLGQEGKEGEAKDGMDIALCIVDLEKMKLQYAGAYNPFYLFRNNELIEVKADRMPIGIYIKEKDSFTNHEIDLQKDDVFYIFSDGFQDQFGGEDGSKFKTKKFKQLLLEIHQKPMEEQHKILEEMFDQWRGKWEQVDDIIVMGVRV
ncbi:MAG TPA: SpoIIE family protein phosphatase [Bacteroidales bacterium]|nr:SpoIIE family protein phosphatase [Bacteroidales bacterium]